MQQDVPLGAMLGRAAHLSKACLEGKLTQYDLTQAQTHVLLYLHKNGGQTPQWDLTAFLKVRPSTANGILDRMVEKGLVTRSVSGSDARRRLITLTEKGQAQQALFARGFHAFEAQLIQGLTDEEVAVFRRLLGRIIQNLEEDQNPC